MIFTVTCTDKPGALALRKANVEAHRAHWRESGLDILAAGPLVEDDGETMVGSLFLIEAPDRAAVERVARADPFVKLGVYEAQVVRGFMKRMGRWGA